MVDSMHTVMMRCDREDSRFICKGGRGEGEQGSVSRRAGQAAAMHWSGIPAGPRALFMLHVGAPRRLACVDATRRRARPDSITSMSSRAEVMLSTSVVPGTDTTPLGSFLISSLGALYCRGGGWGWGWGRWCNVVWVGVGAESWGETAVGGD